MKCHGGPNKSRQQLRLNKMHSRSTKQQIFPEDYDHYKVCRNKAKDMMRQARLNYESQLIANIKTWLA